MLTDSAGVVQRRFDYLPFGELVPASTNGRTPGMGYLATAVQIRLKFTGQQKDGSTTGLDFFNARYLSGAQGRFTSADPANAGASLGDPQSWNGYAYVNNNPLTYTDPSGEGVWTWVGLGLAAGAAFFTGGAAGPLLGISAAAAAKIGAVLTFAAGSSGVANAIGGLTSCGGPLGNCGSLNRGAWSESTGIGPGVNDPGGLLIQNFQDNNSQLSQSAGGISLTLTPSKKKIAGCLARGVIVGAGGALLVGGAAAGAAAVGVPAGLVTGGLLLVGSIGGAITTYSVGKNISNGNYTGAAFEIGSLAGGAGGGRAVGGRVGDIIKPPATRGWSLGRDWNIRYRPSMGSPSDWLGTGPDAAATGGSTGFSGAAISRVLRGGC